MKHIHRNLCVFATVVAAALSLNSCIIQQGVEAFIRDEYPGDRPPMVITDPNAPNVKWLKADEDMLPPANRTLGQIRKAEDGIPYGLPSEFSNIVTSPHDPHCPLDYTGVPVGSKVWDPYTHKPFYIPRTFTIN